MKTKLLLAAIIILGIFLRAPIMKWGLPDREHFCLFDSDEYTAIMLLEHMEPKKLNFLPLYFPYNTLFPDPVFHYYVLGATEVIASKLKLIKITTDKGYYLNHPNEYAKLFLIGRFLSLLTGLLTIILVYMLGQYAYGEWAGLLAAFFLSITPLHVVYSAVLNVAEPAAMWITLTILFSLMLYTTKQRKWYILTGVSAGLALSTKYTAAPVLITILVSHTLAEKRFTLNKNAFLCFLSAIAVFFTVNPYFLIKFQDFLNIFIGRINWVLAAKNIPSVHRDYLYPLTSLLNHSMGFPLLMLSVFGVVLAFIKRTDYDLILLSWVLIYYLLNAHSGIYYIRYQTEQLPLMLLFAARSMVWIYGVRRWLAILIFVFTVVITLTLTQLNIVLLKSDFPRTIASHWITENIKDGASIGVAQLPNEYYPPVIFMQFHHATRYKEAPLEHPLYNITNLNFEPSNLIKADPEYIVLTGSDYSAEYSKFPQGGEFISILDKQYRLENKFDIEPELFGLKLTNKEYPAWVIRYDRVLLYKKVKQ